MGVGVGGGIELAEFRDATILSVRICSTRLGLSFLAVDVTEGRSLRKNETDRALTWCPGVEGRTITLHHRLHRVLKPIAYRIPNCVEARLFYKRTQKVVLSWEVFSNSPTSV